MVGTSISSLALTSLALFSVSFASSAFQSDVLQLDKRAPQFCGSGGISKIASLMMSRSATSFCSDFLDITTVTVPATETLQTYTTSTSTIDEYRSTTQTVFTRTLGFTVTTTVNTLPTTVTTQTTFTTTTSVVISTPPRVTVTTTTWVSPLRKMAVRTVAADSIPTYLGGFASPAISSGCSCLNIPTPTFTDTTTTYKPNTVNTQVTKTITNTIDATLTVSSTSTIRTTSYVPVTSVSTSTVRSTTTSVLPTPTFTSTITSTFRPQCTKLNARPKLYPQITAQRSYTYPFATELIAIQGGGESTFSWCCELCYNTPNCAFFYTYQARPSEWRCQRISSTSQSGVTTPQCPLGRRNDEGVGPAAAWTPQNQARGIGPCFGYTVPV